MVKPWALLGSPVKTLPAPRQPGGRRPSTKTHESSRGVQAPLRTRPLAFHRFSRSTPTPQTACPELADCRRSSSACASLIELTDLTRMAPPRSVATPGDASPPPTGRCAPNPHADSSCQTLFAPTSLRSRTPSPSMPVVMMAHQNEGMDLHLESLRQLRYHSQEPPPIGVVTKEDLPAIAPAHHMVPGVGQADPPRSRHGTTLRTQLELSTLQI
jgi:hypothetical protein